MLVQTQAFRDKLLADFEAWLGDEGTSLANLMEASPPNLDSINGLLEKYGRAMFRAGRPYGHYSELVNAIAGRKPIIKRSLQPAWDLAYSWLRREPPIHHVALPWQALLALISTALIWGRTREAGVLALSFGGITRTGEVTAALRKNLVLPADLHSSVNFALLEINEPKTRFRAARHQAARVDQPQLLRVLEIAFERLVPEQKLWPWSPQTLRGRFQKLLKANHLHNLPADIKKGLDLGSLRAGGASWLLLTTEDSELTRRRGRWLNCKVMEVYVQEISALQFLPRLDEGARGQIMNGASIFPWCLARASQLHMAMIPEKIWFLLFKSDAAMRLAKPEQGGEMTGASYKANGALAIENGSVNHPTSLERKDEREVLEKLVINFDCSSCDAQASPPRPGPAAHS